jgi:hypothetical protein
MKITTLSQLQSDFGTALENSINKKFTIENETKEVLNYINTIPNANLFRKSIKPTLENKASKIFVIDIPSLLRNLFSEAFNNYMTTGNYELKRLHTDTDEMYQINKETVKQANVFSEYYKWLNELQATPQKAEKKNTLSHKEKMLALYYLGLDMRKFSNNKQSAIILSKILGLDESNTKDYLTYFEGNKGKVKTEANINKMLDLFENQDFKEIQKKIKEDLEK